MTSVLVAPFVTSALVDLPWLVRAKAQDARNILTEHGLDGWDLLTASEPGNGALIHEHEPVGATLVPRRLLSARLRSKTASPFWLDGVWQVELSVGVHGTGALVLWCDATAPEVVETIGRATCGHVGQLAHEVSMVLRACLPTGGVTAGKGQYPVDDFLWWHRVFLDDGQPGTLTEFDLPGAHSINWTPSCGLHVGDGYSVLKTNRTDDLAAFARGIVDAQEVWLTGEIAAREVVRQMALLQTVGGLANSALAEAALEADAVSEAQALRAAVLQDQIRYTTGLRRAAIQAASEAWGMSLALEPVGLHLTVLRQMLTRRLDQRRLRQEKRLSLWVFVLGLVTALGLVLSSFETAFGLKLEYYPSRLAFSSVIMAMAALILIGAATYLKRQGLDDN